MVVVPAQKLRIASWNILHGEQIPPVSNLSPTQWKNNLITGTQQISQNLNLDFIGIQEVDYNQNRSGNLNQTKIIADEFGFSNWVFLPTLFGTPGESWFPASGNENELITNQSTDLPSSPSYGIGFATNQEIKRIYFKHLGRSLIGMPLLIPKVEKTGVQFIYVKDEPRVVLVAELVNGLTIAITHLSFVPGVNLFQLTKINKFLNQIPGQSILIGDFNLPANLPAKLPAKLGGLSSLVTQNTYPSWKPATQFDYILSNRSVKLEATALRIVKPIISDHLPIGVEITFSS